MRSFFILLLTLGWLTAIQAQIRVTGSVTDAQGESLPGATATLKMKGKSTGALTDAQGKYAFEVQETGTYRLEIRMTGFEAHSQSLKLEEEKTYSLSPIQLREAAIELQTVEIVGRGKQDYNSEYSFSATKTSIENKKLPQSLISITKELISDRQAFQIAEAVKTVSGVSNSSFYNHFNIRGISQNESGQILNGLRTRQYYFLQPITSNIERVEVIKGPASVTFSSVDPGGSVNMVTKKPLAEARKEVSMSVGSFSTLRAAMDFTGPVDDKGKLLYRLNAGVQKAESFRDLVQNNALLISPSISYLPSENTSVNVEMIYSNGLGNLDRGQPIFGAVAGETDLNSTPITTNLGATNDHFLSEQWIMTTSLSQKLTEKVRFNGTYMKQTWREDLAEHRSENSFAIDSSGNTIENLARMRYSQRKQFWDVDNLNAYFNFDLATGPAQHQLLVGYDLHRWHRTNGDGQNSARGYILNDGSATRSYDPANGADYQMIEIDGVVMPKPNVDHFDLANPSNTIKNVQDYTMNSVFAIPPNLSTTHAAYVQDKVQFGKLTALLSARYEWFEDITNYKLSDEQVFRNTAFIPRVGLSYALRNNLNVFATYLTGFQPQSNTVDMMPSTVGFFWSTNSAAQFDPLISDLKELGAKASFFDNALTLNFALYEINQQNILTPSAIPDVLEQRGADRSRGVELDLNGYVLPNLQLSASYSYIHAIILEDDDESLIGERKENTPEHNANLWSRYDFASSSALDGFGVGLGAQYSSSRIPWYTRDFLLPAFTVFDAAVYFQPKDSNMQLMLKLNNLLNETYWLGAINYSRLFPGAPRNGLFTVTYNF